MRKETWSHIFVAMVAILLGVSMVAAGYYYYRSTKLEDALQALKQEYAQAQQKASSSIDALNQKLNHTQQQLSDTQYDLEREKNKNQDFEEQIKGLAGTVGTLDKIANTDKELLQKYSKVYFLNENYYPKQITQIPNKYVLDGKSPQFFQGKALPFLEDMINAADDDDVTLKVDSAFRSFDEQSDLKDDYKQTFGSGANTFSADQGYSEHQLGTTVDLTNTEVAGTYERFKGTQSYQWLQKNAYRYGFILSYPENNQYYVFEPWHWRFVGRDLARYLHDHDMYFYDMKQRDIDTYLPKLFD